MTVIWPSHTSSPRGVLPWLAFSYPALPDQDEIIPAPDEGGGGQLLDLDAVDGVTVELPVEGTQRLEFTEPRLADPAGDAALPALGRLIGQEQVQELLVRPGFPLGAGQHRVELLSAQGNLERREVGQDRFTEIGRECRCGVLRGRQRFRSAGHAGSVPPR